MRNKKQKLYGELACIDKMIEILGRNDGTVVGMTANENGDMLIIRIPNTMLPGIKTLAEIERTYVEQELKEL